MTANELKRIFQKGECLSLETMKLYTEGKLPKKSAHLVEEHLLECGLCAGAIDGLNSKRIAEVTRLSSHIQRRLSVYMNTPPRVPFFRRYGFSIVAGLILLSGGTTVWYLATKNSSQQQHITDSTNAAIQRQASIDIRDAGTTNPVVSDNTVVNPGMHTDNTSQTNQSGSNVSTSNNLQNLPATQPGKTNTLSVDQSTTTSTTASSSTSTSVASNDGSNTRTANTIEPLKIKNVVPYPPVTHDNGKSSSSSGGGNGQLAMSQQSSANFKLDEMPTYTGGDEAIRNYIMGNFKSMNLDKSLITRYTNGAIVTVNAKTGEVTDVQLSYSINKAADDELTRVLKSMKWNPGKKRGSVDIMIGVTFE